MSNASYRRAMARWPVVTDTRRRAFLTLLAGALASCGSQPTTTSTGGTVTTPTTAPTPPTIDQVKAFLNALSPELPIFVNELLTGNQITPAVATVVNGYIGTLQTLITQLDQVTAGVNAQTLVNQIGQLIATIMSAFPQSAPFVPLLITLQAVITAYLAQQAMTSPSGAPEPVPAPPTTAAFISVHAQTRAFRH